MLLFFKKKNVNNIGNLFCDDFCTTYFFVNKTFLHHLCIYLKRKKKLILNLFFFNQVCCSIISPYSLQSPHKYIIINLALLSKRGSSILDHPVFLSFVFVLLFTDECVSFLINNVIINSTFFLPYYLRQYYLCAIKKTRITLHFTIMSLRWE